MRRSISLVGFGLFAVCGLVALAADGPAKSQGPPKTVAAEKAGYDQVAAPFLTKYCGKCHAGDKLEGEFSVEAGKLVNDFTDPASKSRWKEVVNVLNSHEMPPEDARQPKAEETAAFVDWITAQAVRAELANRERGVVLRRLNRAEYRNTIRDLLAVDFDVSGFPQDPPAGGFDNNGGALTLSPLHIEMYVAAAQQILDRALVEGDKPATIKWRFDPKVGPADRVRLRIDERNNPLVNGSNNQEEGEWVVVHHHSWDKGVGARDFRVPVAGDYVIRARMAGRVPDRAAVVAAARVGLAKRRDEQDAQNPNGKKWTQEAFERDLRHFETDRMYDYGPPRAKLVLQLGPQPKTVAEFDVTALPDKGEVIEFRTRFTTETAGIGYEYAYSIPRVLENFWMQGHDKFARPELMIDWFEVEGPIYEAWPPPSHTAILGEGPGKTEKEPAYARKVVERFMERAFRRPVTKDEVDAKLKLFTAARQEKPFLESIKVPLVATLASPHFLFLVETTDPVVTLSKSTATKSTPAKAAATKRTTVPAAASGRSLGNYELASRMSYFLWSAPPDEELLALAKAGKLVDGSVREAQVDRMLKHPKSNALVTNFVGQWLNLRDVGANPPAEDLYPQYDRHLETSMIRESEGYFREFLDHDLDARQMIRSDFVTINERLARYYGIPDVRGDAIRRVSVPDGVVRGGIVTQASILTITSNGTRTSPVKRGTWILKTLLGIDPGLPVANAGEIAPKVPGIDKATVRKRLEIHRELPQCARCHNKIDPLGFALENYNAAGEYRLREGFGYKGRIEQDDPLIDASSKMIDGEEINGVAGLQEAMLRKDDLFLTALASKLMTYACGRELGLADQPAVKQAVARMRKDKLTVRSLVKAIVTSEPFSTK
jgi:mono/diheme cytochrome c family protein